MPGLNAAMLIGENALRATQNQMTVIGNNVSNASRPEYRRQTAALTENQPISTLNGEYGMGAHVQQIVRAYDKSLETSLQTSLQEDSYNQTYASQLELVEQGMAAEGTSTLTESIQSFADTWQEVANSPETIEKRNALLEQGQNMTEQFNLQRGRLSRLRNDLADETSGSGYIKNSVAELNSLAQEVNRLNNDIKEIENRLFNPQNANDFRDRRDELVRQMSSFAGVEVTELPDTTYQITLGGHEFVSKDGVDTINVNMAGSPATPALSWQSDASAVTLGTGEIQGLLDSRTYIQNRIADYDAFATELANEVNTQHVAGEDLNSNAGTNLLDATTPGNMQMALTDAKAIAAAEAGGGRGDGDNAREIWKVLNSPNAAINDNSLLGHNDAMINDLARNVSLSRNVADGSEGSVQMFQQAIAEESGVSMDEEMQNMLQVQRAYQASAKFISIVDGMVSSVLQWV